MNQRRGLILDTCILMRAVLGPRVRELLETNDNAASFYKPNVRLLRARMKIIYKVTCLHSLI